MDDFLKYEDREEWKDIKPLPQNDGPNPAVPIAYTKDFKNVMDYFRAVVMKNEKSLRVLELLKDVIDQNAANYTAWFYRRLCLFELKCDLEKEMSYLDEIILDGNEKNYQVWYHRQEVLNKLDSCDYSELKFVDSIFDIDAKNYHAWQHRQWVLKRFNLWDNELNTVDKLLEKDFRNNSAWNHRFYVIKSTKANKNEKEKLLLDEKVREEEINYSFKFIEKAPNNESAWNYAFGMANYKVGPKEASFQLLKKKTKEVIKKVPVNIHAHWVLLECLIFEGMNEQNKSDAITLCENLIKFDGVRKRYWKLRKDQISNDDLF